MGRCGTGADHCCYISGVVCPFLIPSYEAGYNWACSLRQQKGSWDEVHASKEYKVFVQPALRTAGIEQDCGHWPPPGVKCGDCGMVG